MACVTFIHSTNGWRGAYHRCYCQIRTRHAIPLELFTRVILIQFTPINNIIAISLVDISNFIVHSILPAVNPDNDSIFTNLITEFVLPVISSNMVNFFFSSFLSH